jgi:dTDP-4-dehydrorhamnose reductase
VTGAAGLIGNYVVGQRPKGWKAISLTRQTVDLTNPSAVEHAFLEDRPDAIIHCAAMSRSVDCEKNPEAAWLTNVEVTRRLAGLAADIPLLFLSTDLVFDGKKGHYSETDLPSPLTQYGRTKVAAEEIVLKNPRHLVVRTSLNGGASFSGDRGFNHELRQAWCRGEDKPLFTDEFRSPVHASVTARACWWLLAGKQAGLFHVAGTERLSRFEIGKIVAARHPELSPRFHASSIAEYAGLPRAPDTSLDCSKVAPLLPFPLQGLRQWLAENPMAEL